MRALFPLCFLTLASCLSFEKRIAGDPRYSSGITYETKQPIPPRITTIGKYTFVTGHSVSASSFGMYYREKEMLFQQTPDGVFDTIVVIDNPPSYLYTVVYEDGTDLYYLRQIKDTSFLNELISSEIHSPYCDDNLTSDSIIDFLIRDVNVDGANDLLINPKFYQGKIIATNCTDTILFDRKTSKFNSNN